MTPARALDIPFGPRLTHRLRVSDGAFDPANPVLAELMPCDRAEGPARACVVLDSGLAAAAPSLAGRVAAYFEAHGSRIRLAAPVRVITGGEAAKNDRRALDEALALIHEAGLCRKSYVLAVGGGALLDVVGLAAALAHRGVRLIRVPTTTLSQDDSCVAVKNGINLFGQKNYLGAFAAPWGVVIDHTLLATLPDRDWRAGFSEAVKVALVKDGAFFTRLEDDAPAILARQSAASRQTIERAAELHLRHITDGGDPYELADARPLDFGHWAAHRLEAMTGFALRHGEAVAIGIAIDTEYSALAGLLGAADRDRVHACLRSLGLATSHPALTDADALLAGLEQFREHLGGRLTIAMLEGIGRARDVHTIDQRLMRRAIDRVRAAGQ